MQIIGLIFFLLLWGLVIFRQLLILLRHFGREAPQFSEESIFRGTWIIKPLEAGAQRALSADIVILAAYILVEIVVLVFLFSSS
jgi:hypothetical protein